MIKEAFQYLVSLAEPHFRLENGVTYSDRSLSVIEPPRLDADDALHFPTLQGFADYCTSKFDPLMRKTAGALAIHVADPWNVHLLNGFHMLHRTRERFASAIFDTGAIYQFGRPSNPEQFIIGVMTLFEDSDERRRLLTLVGNMTKERVESSVDDGVAQTVGTRAGIALVARKGVENPFTLAPYRTFVEVAQPESPFILRVHQQGDNLPSPALYEADNGRWKVDAHFKIKNWLKEALGDSEIEIFA